MEGSTRGGEVCGLLTSFVSCVVLGPWRRELPCSQAAWRDREASEGAESKTQSGRAGGHLCAEPAWMQEHELRRGSMRHCGAERRRSHWPSTTGADPIASSGVPPATAPDSKPVRGSNSQHWRREKHRGRRVGRVAAAGRVRRRRAP
eukprot:4162087-Pleurochrysis_carterae.AAC.1